MFFVCLFVRGLSSHSRTCHLYGDVIIAVIELQILTCARHSCLLSSEGSFACHTSVYNGHIRGPVTLTPAERLAEELSLPVSKT